MYVRSEDSRIGFARYWSLPVEQIDVFSLELPQALSDGRTDILCVITDLTAALWSHMVAKLGGEEDLR